MDNPILCPNLPLQIDDSQLTLNQLIDKATNILIKDFSLGEVSFRGKKIKAQYPYTDKFSYEHILKLDETNLTDNARRLRCIHAPKFKALLQENANKNCPYFMHWKEFNMKRSQWRHIIVCKKEKLVIVLKELKDSYLLITAYYANFPNYIKTLEKEYINSKTKLK